MFFQYNPHAAVWGDMHWAHAVSPDMIHWQRLPIALAPTPGGPDADGCFTGTAVVANGKPTFLYTGVRTVPTEQATLRDGHSTLKESQCLAVAEDDNLLHWKKLSQPVIPAPPPGMEVTGFRDPSPWYDEQDKCWYTVVGSGQPRKGGEVLLYKSTDNLHSWTYLHPLAQGRWNGHVGQDPVGSGEMWECPDFHPLGGSQDGKYLLIHSAEGKTLWQLGTLDRVAMLFHAETEGVLDHGAYYAPKTQLDAQGNRILWGWIQETRPQADYAAAGWSGMMSLPRKLSIGAAGELIMEPAEEIASLRTAPRTGEAVKLLPTPAQELRFTLEPAPRWSRIAPLDRSFVDKQGAALLLRNDPALDPGKVRIHTEYQDVEIDGLAAGPLDLHIFLDHSVAEIFFNHRQAMTARYYKRDPMEPAVKITLGGAWTLGEQQAWSLKSIW